MATETGHVLLYDATTMQLVSTFPGSFLTFISFRFQLSSLTCAFHHSAHSAPIRSLVFSSSLLITASDDKRINVFDLRALSVGLGSGSAGGRKGQVSSLGGHEGWVCSLGVRNDRLLASGSVFFFTFYSSSPRCCGGVALRGHTDNFFLPNLTTFLDLLMEP